MKYFLQQATIELTRSAHGKQHLHRIEEKEHHKKRDGSAQWQTQRVCRVKRRKTGIYAEKIFEQNIKIESETVLTLVMCHWFARQKVVGAFTLSLFLLFTSFLLHIETSEAAVDDEQNGNQAC